VVWIGLLLYYSTLNNTKITAHTTHLLAKQEWLIVAARAEFCIEDIYEWIA